MKQEDIQPYIEGCFNGELASCSYACPFRMNLRSFLKKVENGRWKAAYREMCTTLIFPEVVSVLCPGTCKNSCQRKLVGDEPIAVKELEEAVLTILKEKRPPAFPIPEKDKKVAIIGAGPAGLACALGLAQKRFKVSVFEKKPYWGGCLSTHDMFNRFDEDFKRQFSCVNVSFFFNHEIMDIEGLFSYDAIFIATGSNGNDFGLSYGYNTSPSLHSKVFMGGGLVGQDLMTSIYAGYEEAKEIEAFLQNSDNTKRKDEWNTDNQSRYLQHEGVIKVPLVQPKNLVYTEDEARQEAARCLHCNCERCIRGCELLSQYGKNPHQIASEILMDGQARNSVSSAAIMRQTWSCNLCGRCEMLCNTGADIGTLFKMSRCERVEQGMYPPALHEFWMRELKYNMTKGFLAKAPDGKEQCEFVFFPGCRLGESNPEYVLKTYELLRQKYDMGIILGCCGIPAVWAGETHKFNGVAEKIKNVWEDMGKPVFVVACPSCEKTFKNEFHEIQTESLYSLLIQFANQNNNNKDYKMAVFDPCSASYRTDLKQTIRTLAEKLGIDVSEYDNNGKCCGFGGHMQIANPSLYDDIVSNRVTDREEPYITYCSNCKDVFSTKGKECKHILDLFFELDNIDVPDLDKRRENALMVKNILLESCWKEKTEIKASPWDSICLEIEKQLKEKMEKLFISSSDVKKTIWEAEKEGLGFRDQNGSILCYRIEKYLTYWVQYYKLNNDYKIINVYSHRMRIRGPGENVRK